MSTASLQPAAPAVADAPQHSSPVVRDPGPPPLRILHLEDNPTDAELVRRNLIEGGLNVEISRVFTPSTYTAALEEGRFDLILSDYTLPGFDGGSALTLARQKCPQTPFIFVSGTLGEEAAIQSLKNGATNYVLKDRIARLVPALLVAIEESAEREKFRKAEEAVRERAEFFQLISEKTTDLVAVLDLEGRRLYTSPSYQTLFGNESLRGTDAFADVHPEDRERIRQLFKDTVKTGAGQPAEFRFLLKNGTIRYIESHGGVIRDKEGNVWAVIVVSKDVTKRKLAENALSEAEDRFRSIVQTANDAIVLADGAGNIVSWNAAAQRMFGYPEGEICGNPLKLLLAERYRERHDRGFGLTSAASRFIAVAIELYGRRKDGSEFPLELSVSTWKTGDETFYNAIFRDITERHRTHQTLRQLRRHNELLLNAAGEGFCGLDREGRITFANPAAAQMLGHQVDELIGRSFHEVVSFPDRSNPQLPTFNSQLSVYATLKDGREHRASDQLFWRKNGKSFPVQYVTTPIRDRGGVNGAVVVFQDITERQRQEQQMREQAALLANATDAICVIDMDGLIIFWNKSAERLYGWTAAEAVGKPAPNLLFAKDSHRPSQAFKTIIEKHGWEGELRQVNKTGREIIVQSRWTLMHDSSGAPKSILVINTDISEQKAFEARFLRAQRLESIGRLAAGIGHDLNNVLSPILMISQLLAPKLKDENDKKLMETLEASAQRGAEMVKQILSFSRGMEGTNGVVELKRVIDEQVKIGRQIFPPEVTVEGHVAKDLWPVQGNATQLFQMLMNLCVNARDAMANAEKNGTGGGTLTVQAENVVLDHEYVQLHREAKPGPHVVLTVSDTGPGIAPGILDKIFEPFVTGKRGGKGSGLGLFTVSTIVKNHQGHLQVKSEPGKGTAFKIFLPALSENIRVHTCPSVVSSPAPPRGNGEWVLVVDNEVSVREITTATLEHFGYRVLTAGDGTEALARYAKYQDRISLVVSDLVMPYMDGPSTIRALRRMNPALKIMAVSGRLESKPALGQPDIPFLEKPFSSEKLLVCVHKILNGQEQELKNKN